MPNLIRNGIEPGKNLLIAMVFITILKVKLQGENLFFAFFLPVPQPGRTVSKKAVFSHR